MLTQLAYRNVKRSIKDYFIYIITITIVVSLMFAFNSMMFSDMILGMNSHMTDYMFLLVLFSIIVVIIIAWLINYMTRFMLDKRSKEFGTYLLLGMENKKISKLFLCENILLGIISFIFGVILGSFIFQLLTAVVTAFFGKDFNIVIGFDIKALLLTILYYGAIMFLVTLKNNRRLKKMKICDLLYVDKKNDVIKIKNIKKSCVMFVLSLIAGIVALKGAPVIVTLICVVFFIYSFYMGISGVMVMVFSKSKVLKYKKTNIFLFRQLSSKINTMGFTMGTLAVLFTLTLLSSNYAVGLSSFKDEIEQYVPFDVCISVLNQDEKFEDVSAYMDENDWIKESIVYGIYKGATSTYTDVLVANEISGGYFQYDTYLKVSDYNVLRRLLSLDEITLSDNEFLIHAVSSASDSYIQYIEKNPTMDIDNITYSCKGVYSENFSQNGQNGAGFILVVPDEAVSEMEVYYSQYAASTKRESNEKLYKNLKNYILQDADKWASSGHRDYEIDHGMGIDSVYMIYDNIMVKNGGLDYEVKAAIITVVSSIFYVALVFACVAFTVLAVQQLSDSAKYKYRYRILNQLGLYEKERNQLVFKQLLIYFMFPIVIPIIVSFTISMKLNQQLLRGTQLEATTFTFYGATLILFLVVYSIYFVATYVGFKRNISL
ncbi:ABC transporter permease [Oceanirhabdus seepicola]|uniref:ABC transporter permease n=1 Tax=Oceanirhabdus seepicola TaxID=2828781 RepID=A0A9J6NYY5_9CLOT|nr:FtsX-like permease family protein [Oceanirhabdus seepicola]MCM1988360.1 ABC transporter permease [Oceanirhabdus seepicola]